MVDHLSAVFVCQLLHRLDFQDDLVETQEVRLVLLLQGPAFVFQLQARLLTEQNSLFFEFKCQTLLVHGLDEPVALVLVCLEASAHDPVALVPENDSIRLHLTPLLVAHIAVLF